MQSLARNRLYVNGIDGISLSRLKDSPVFLLVTGIILTAATGNRWGIPLVAWVSAIPFLLYVRRISSWKGYVILALALQAGIGIQVLKIITDPIPVFVAPLYSVPMALGAWIILAVWNLIRKKSSETTAIYSFAVLVAVSEWVSYALSDFGVWGTYATTQVDNLVLLQLASVFGVAGIGLLMAWAAGLGQAVIAVPAKINLKKQTILFLAVLSAVHVYGSIRLFSTQDATVKVGAVVSELGMDKALSDPTSILREEDRLFERSAMAAAQGARLIAWNEGATLIEPEREPQFLDRARSFARNHRVDFVPAYIVPVSANPMRYENKYVWIDERGKILEVYQKHHPVPGEPTMKGTDPIRVMDRPYGKVSGAICYDYDFPEMARIQGQQEAGLVVVPASDWKGIDPYHTQMARVRAIEGGFSVVRPVRWASSAAFDAYGRVRGWLPYFEQNQRVMTAVVPVSNIGTLYARFGDVWLLPAVLLMLAGIIRTRKKQVS